MSSGVACRKTRKTKNSLLRLRRRRLFPASRGREGEEGGGDAFERTKRTSMSPSTIARTDRQWEDERWTIFTPRAKAGGLSLAFPSFLAPFMLLSF